MGLHSPKLGLRALSSLGGPKLKFLLGLKLWGFLAGLGTSPKIPVPASLCTLPMPSDSQDSLASLPLSSQNLPPLPCPSQCPQLCPLRAIWDSAAVAPLSLHLFLMCQRWLRSGSKQGQKLLSASGIFSGKMEKSVQNQELVNPKVSAEEKEQGELSRVLLHRMISVQRLLWRAQAHSSCPR